MKIDIDIQSAFTPPATKSLVETLQSSGGPLVLMGVAKEPMKIEATVRQLRAMGITSIPLIDATSKETP